MNLSMTWYYGPAPMPVQPTSLVWVWMGDRYEVRPAATTS